VRLDRDDCYLYFSPPADAVPHLQRCPEDIHRCNTTGQWREYDPFLESACFSYKSVYKGFRNVHCFLCNGHTADEIGTLCNNDKDATDPKPMYTFISLLDFNILEEGLLSDDLPSKACSEGYLLDQRNVSIAITITIYLYERFTLGKKTNFKSINF